MVQHNFPWLTHNTGAKEVMDLGNSNLASFGSETYSKEGWLQKLEGNFHP